MRHGFVYACCCASCDILCNAECGSSHNFDRYRYAVIDVCCDGPARRALDMETTVKPRYGRRFLLRVLPRCQ
jgi:hypothetical protein